MRSPVVVAMTGLTALVIGLGIRSGMDHRSATAAAAAPPGIVTTEPSAPDSTGAGASSPSPVPSHRPAATSTRVNGSAADTRYGPVQVQITVRSGRITAAHAIDYPTQGRRDKEINGYAIPQLDDETLRAQGASIDAVSGATYTSDGYVTSLQSAIDQAHSAGLL